MIQPMIHTSNGNLPVDSLVYQTKWMCDEHNIKFIETYLLDDEVVRQSEHVLCIDGVYTTGVAQALN